MGELLRLPVVEVSEVQGPEDRFRCRPYSAILAARTCIARRAAGSKTGGPERPGEALRRDSTAKRGDYGLCRGCGAGEAVAKAVGAVTSERPALLILPKAPGGRPRGSRNAPRPKEAPKAVGDRKTRQEVTAGQGRVCAECGQPGHDLHRRRRRDVAVRGA